MFNTVFTIFQGGLSRAFWFGSFLPVLIVAAVHLGIAGALFPEHVPVRVWVLEGTGTAAATLTLIFVVLLVVAYMLMPLQPLLRDFLDGRLLPDWLHYAMRKARMADIEEARKSLRTARSAYKAMRDLLVGEKMDDLREAREKGMKVPVQLAAAGKAAIDDASKACSDLEVHVRDGVLAPSDARRAYEALKNALAQHPAHASGAAAPLAADARRLHETHQRFLALVATARLEARHRVDTLTTRYLTSMPLDVPQATRFGDVRRICERHSDEVYGVDFSYLWPRLQVVMPEKDGLSERLAGAKAQVDFALLCTFLATSLAVWPFILAFSGRLPVLFLALAAAVPLAAAFFYEMAVQSQFAYGEVVRTAIDRYRLDVLKQLRQPLPATLFAERELWKRLQQAERPGIGIDLVYRHPAS